MAKDHGKSWSLWRGNLKKQSWRHSIGVGYILSSASRQLASLGGGFRSLSTFCMKHVTCCV